jgi:four helix bundle protein
MGKFRKLKVWQRGKDLAVYIYKATREGSFAKDYGLRDQIRRASVSIPSNIAGSAPASRPEGRVRDQCSSSMPYEVYRQTEYT